MPVAWAVWVLIVAGNKVFYPVAGALSEALPPRESRATYMATYQYAFTAAQVVAPAVVALFAVQQLAAVGGAGRRGAAWPRRCSERSRRWCRRSCDRAG